MIVKKRLLENLIISKKMFLVIGILIVISTVIAFAGIFGLTQTLLFDRKMHEEKTLPYVDMSNIVENVMLVSSSFDMAILADGDMTQVDEYQKIVNEANETSKQLFASYDVYAPQTQTHGIYQEAKDIFFNTLLPTSSDIFNLLKEGDIAKAEEYMGAVDVKIGGMIDSFNACQEDVLSSMIAERLQNEQRTMIFIGFVVLVFIAGLIFSIIIGKKLTNVIKLPMQTITQISGIIGNTGNLDISNELEEKLSYASHRADELGKTSLAFIAMRDTLRQKDAVLNKIAEGDLTSDIVLLSEYDSIGLSLQSMQNKLARLISEVNDSCREVSRGSVSVSESSYMIADNVSKQSALIEEINAAVNEIASKIEQTHSNAERSMDCNSKTLNNADHCSDEMNRLTGAMGTITEQSREISHIINTINDIAFQTNILALNASVEAARAGDAGKGFAVVADEVRNLASKVTDAAKDIGELIESSILSIENGEKTAQTAKSSMELILTGINGTVALSEVIAKNSGEQNESIKMITKEMSDVADFVTGSAAAAEEASATGNQLNEQVKFLRSAVDKFKL